MFWIIPSESDGNWIFHTLNNVVLGWQSSASDMWSEIWNYLEKKKEVYHALCEGDFENHLLNMRRNRYWGINLELLAFLI